MTSGAAAYTGNIRIGDEKLLKDPEYRKARLVMLRASIVQSYPGLAEELGLTREEVDRLFDLMAETQINKDSQSSLVLTGDQQADQAVIAEINQHRQALQQVQGESLRAMLGDARYAQWQQYLPTRSVRIQANTYATALAQAGAPLRGAQLKGLVAVMLEEQKSLRQDTVALGRMVDPSNPVSQAQAQVALQNRQAASNQRVLDAASSQLTALQQILLREQFEREDSIKQAKERTWERTGVLRLQQ